MEEKKLSVDIQKRDLSQHVQKIDSPTLNFGKGDDQRSMMGDGVNDNWYELRFSTIGPDRRGYHSSFIHNKKYNCPFVLKYRLYIYGGHDIREGSKDTLYMLDLRKLKDLEIESG